MSNTSDQRDLLQLRNAFLLAKSEQKLRNRDAAEMLGISEGEAIAACVGFEAIRLLPRFIELFEEMPLLGPVMALTRNDSAVHEKDGIYENISHNEMIGLALGETIDLRIFYQQWAFGYAVFEKTSKGIQKSLQFYNHHGHAIHKVFLRQHSHHSAFDQLVSRWRDPDQQAGIRVMPTTEPTTETPDNEIDVKGFHNAWGSMTDTHQFFGLLRKFGVSRTQALRLAPSQFARRVNNDATRSIIEQAAKTALPIMVFVGNNGMIQIHSGPVVNINVMEPWLNVLDSSFNLHLREDLIMHSWVVSKPTSDGEVTSLELFDHDGQTIAMLFGVRKPGQPELPAWRQMLVNLTSAQVSA